MFLDNPGHPIWYFWILAGSRKINKVISLVDFSPSNFPTINKRIVQVQQQNRGSLSFTLVFIVTKVTSFWLINLKNLIQNQHRFSDVDRRLHNLLWTSWWNWNSWMKVNFKGLCQVCCEDFDYIDCDLLKCCL